MTTHDKIENLLDRMEREGVTPIDWPEYYEARAAIEADRQRRGEPVGYFYPWELDRSLKAYQKGFPGSVAVYASPQPAEPCESSVSNKTACGSENGNCDSQPAEPVKAWHDFVPRQHQNPDKFVMPAEPVSVPKHLIERLQKHCEDKSNTAFARSTMREALQYLTAEPVKVPSDAESWLEEAIDEVVVAALEEGMCGRAMGDTPLTDSAKAGAMQRIRALLARYGKGTP